MTRVLKPDSVEFCDTAQDWGADRPMGPSSPSTFFAHSHPGAYVFGPVNYHGKAYQVSLSRDPLSDVQRLNQKDWTLACERTRWRIPSIPLQFAYLSTLQQNANGPYRELITEIRYDILSTLDRTKGSVMSGSSGEYRGEQFVFVVHDVDTPQQWEVGASLGGPRSYPLDELCFLPNNSRLTKDEILIYKALTGIPNMRALNRVVRWLGLSGAFCSLPAQISKPLYGSRVVTLDWYEGHLWIDAMSTFSNTELPARIVSLEEMVLK